MMPSAREMVLASAFMRNTSRKSTTRMVEISRSKGSSFATVSFLMRMG